MIARFFSFKEFTGYHMAAVMVLFFGVIISVNLTMAFFAETSWTGLVVKNSYVESQLFNEKTEERHRQMALGWQAAIGYEDNRLSLALTDKAGNPLDGAVVTLALGRPTHEQDDVTIHLLGEGGGVYAAEADLAHGAWYADAKVIGAHGDNWTQPMRLFVKDKK